MVLNVLIKMKTRIYATPAIKGLNSIPILKILTIYNGRRHKRIQMKQKELPETFQIEKYPFFSSFIYLYYRTLRDLTPQDPVTPPPFLDPPEARIRVWRAACIWKAGSFCKYTVTVTAGNKLIGAIKCHLLLAAVSPCDE